MTTPAQQGIEAAKHDDYMRLLEETTKKRIDEMWNSKRGIIDWLILEQFIADTLSSELNDKDKVAACKEALDAITRRGHFGPWDYFKRA